LLFGAAIDMQPLECGAEGMVDSKVVHETDTGEAKGDESRWMRLTLDTVGKTSWPADTQGRPIYPEGFEELAGKLERPLHPPGRDVRCIVSVGMLTEGWDCNTVTHIIGIRPFMSQLLCEQVVGRGLQLQTMTAEAHKDAIGAKAAAEKLAGLAQEPGQHAVVQQIITMQAREAQAFAAKASGNADEAIVKMKEAVAIEDAIDTLSQPPYPVIPAH
jgi:hypothetical protein